MRIFLSLLFLSFIASAELKHLELVEIHESDSTIELSGFAFYKGSLVTVSDNRDETQIFSISFVPKKAVIKEELNVKDFNGFWRYYLSSYLFRQDGRWLKSPWDLEGITVCGEDIYLANEQTRNILKLSNGKLTKLKFGLSKALRAVGANPEKTSVNAGIEGIAMDCESNTLYIAQERSPRAIIVADLNKNKVVKSFSTPAVENPNPDYADLYFEKGFLYVLERNKRMIIKVDPKSEKVVDEASYLNLADNFKASELYDTGKPYGVGEALFMDSDFIYIGNDNNWDKFSEKAKSKFGLSSSNSSTLRFKRPKGF